MLLFASAPQWRDALSLHLMMATEAILSQYLHNTHTHTLHTHHHGATHIWWPWMQMKRAVRVHPFSESGSSATLWPATKCLFIVISIIHERQHQSSGTQISSSTFLFQASHYLVIRWIFLTSYHHGFQSDHHIIINHTQSDDPQYIDLVIVAPSVHLSIRVSALLRQLVPRLWLRQQLWHGALAQTQNIPGRKFVDFEIVDN